MLLELSIRDFAIIDDIRLELGPGFNALTGETGAGKSILIDALGAVLGDRVGSDVVRTGAKQARVEGTFDLVALRERADLAAILDDLGIPLDEDVLVLTREISATGRSQARINGEARTAGALARLGALLVDIHGQSDHLSLLRPRAQLDMLDRYAGILNARRDFADHVRELASLRRRIREIDQSSRERAQRVDLLRFQVSEIEAAALEPDEEAALVQERARLVHAEQLVRDAAAAYVLLTGEADITAVDATGINTLRTASAHLDDVAAVDAGMQSLAERLRETIFLLDDIAAEVRDYQEQIDIDPVRLSEVEDRLDLLKGLRRKYGSTIEEVIAYGRAAAEELTSLTEDAVGIETLRAREAEQLRQAGKIATELSRERQRAGRQLAEAVEAVIAELKMGSARIEVLVEQTDEPTGIPVPDINGGDRTVAFDETGVDHVEFMISPNQGEALKPLARIASGGETARLMLAIKSILSEVDATPTLVFDEVDVGLGGRSAGVVGEKLYDLASEHQVLVITHLPQIAAYADTHYQIAKAEKEGRVITRVAEIGDDQRIEELAAMVDGVPVSRAARESAREMIERASRTRRSRASVAAS
ncbi:MAG TPA: DNA repair protein RecN [Thermomicrobiales bacterium]|nr:DNA repair protein RecN [Thermomicrobiales bacterium]